MMILLSLLGFASAEPTQFTLNSATTLDKGDCPSVYLCRYGMDSAIRLNSQSFILVMCLPHPTFEWRFNMLNGCSSVYLGIDRLSNAHAAPTCTRIGGILAPDSIIPHTIVSKNDCIWGGSDAGELTLSLGVSVALEIGESNYSTIDYAYAFRQTNLYQNNLMLSVGVGWEQFFTEKVGIRTWNKGFYFPTADEQWVVESRDDLVFQVSDRSQALLGVNVSLAEFPWGTQWHAFPAVDWVWIW